MSLGEALFNILNNEKEDADIRLKLAEKVFFNSDVIFQNKEIFVLTWIVENTFLDSSSTWILIKRCLSSDQFENLSRINISDRCIEKFLAGISKKIEHAQTSNSELKQLILESLYLLLCNRVFSHFFECNVEFYCQFISFVISHLRDRSNFIEFIRNGSVIPKSLIHKEKFHKLFLEYNLNGLISSLEYFGNDELIFQEISHLLHRCLYFKNLKSFEAFLNKMFGKKDVDENVNIPKSTFKYFITAYKSDENAHIIFKLLFHSFCSASSEKVDLIYKCFILIFEMIGFDCSEFFTLNKISKYKVPETPMKKSIIILSEILNVLIQYTDISVHKINDKSFSDFLVKVIRSIIHSIGSPDEYCYKIIMNIIEIDPLILESVIDSVLPYVLLSDNRNYKKEHEMLMISIFGVYAKLHRIQNLISKLITSLKHALNEGPPEEKPFSFRGTIDYNKISFQPGYELFTHSVLMFFSQCITTLASWQVINLLKTFIFHLKSTVNDISCIESESATLLCIELISSLLCCLLSGVRIAEYTVPDNVIEKFVTGMEELRELLGDYGRTLLHRKHNQISMKSFLNLCYTWGEVYMLLAYYSEGNVELKKMTDNDTSACNLTYLHSYLTVSQWCLISERITNFGEKPCKLIMQKLFVQKLRTMLLFEDELKEDVKIPVSKALCSNLNESWELIVSDKFVIKHLLEHFNGSSMRCLAEFLLEDITNENKWNLMTRTYLLEDSHRLTNALIYTTLSMVNQQVKFKRKLDDDFMWKPISSKILSSIPADDFILEKDMSEIFVNVKALFHCEISKEDVCSMTSQLNTKGILKYFEVLEKLPIIFGSKVIQRIILYYLFSLHKDTYVSNNLILKKKLETLITGIMDENKIDFIDTFEPVMLIQYLVKHFSEINKLFTIILDNVVKSEKYVVEFENCMQFLTQNVKTSEYFPLNMMLLNAVIKWKKHKLSPVMKIKIGEYQLLLQKTLLKLILKKPIDSKLIEVYATLLKMSLSKNEDDTLSKLKPLLDSFLNHVMLEREDKSLVLLLTTVLRYKSELELSDDFYLQAWNSCEIAGITDETVEEYCPLISLIFQHIPNENFPQIVHSLFADTKLSLEEKNFEQLCRYIKIWMSVLSVDFNAVKTRTWQESLESFVHQLYCLLEENDYDGNISRTVVNFIENISQTVHLPLTPALCDLFLGFPTILLLKESSEFVECYNLSVSLLTTLLKYRKVLMMDRLPPFLQGYRLLLRRLCEHANSDKNISLDEVHRISNCAHSLEKITDSLVNNKKDMSRISCFLIAEILSQFEEITLYPNVKKHLNNCIYRLMTLCDRHAISYLMRVLSSAATEMFKIMFEHYKKYYKFTGKV